VLSEEQKKLRKKYIGASDVPRIMAGDTVSLVKEKLEGWEIEPDLFEAKTAQTYVDELEAVQEIRIGHKAEARILDQYVREHQPTRFDRSPETIINPDYPWLAVHPDQLSYYSEQVINTEAKSVGSYRRRLWGREGDQVPHNVIWQVQTQMLCLGSEVSHVPTCFLEEKTLRQLFVDDQEPITITVFIVRASPKLQDYILTKTEEIAWYLEKKTLPPPQSLDDTVLLYPKSDDSRVEADFDVAQFCVAFDEVREQLKTLESQRDRYKFHIQEFMQQASQMYYNNRLICTWKNDADGFRFDKDALERERPDIYQTYLKPYHGARKLLVKKPK
jgi:hypothetical protein